MRALPLLVLGLIGADPAALPRKVLEDPPVRVWLSSDGFNYAERAQVYVRAAEDGYVVVLYADTRGNVRVLLPLDPDGDHYVRAGKKIEVKCHDGREAFIVDDTTGRGVVLAAFAKSRFLTEKFELNGRWDYQALDTMVAADREAGLLDIVGVMQPVEHFDYDITTYVVLGAHYPDPRLHPRPHPRPWPWWW